MIEPATSTTRVLGMMLLAHEYDNTNICIMGRPVDVNKNSKQFLLKTTDQKQIPVFLPEPVGEYLDGIVQIRGIFDGQKIQAKSYNIILPELSEDFDDASYNETVKILRNSTA